MRKRIEMTQTQKKSGHLSENTEPLRVVICRKDYSSILTEKRGNENDKEN